MNPIRVLMVTVTFGEGSGVNSFIMNYFRSLDHARVRLDVLAYKESPTGKSPYVKEIEEAGGRVFLLPSLKRPLAHLRAIRAILREGGYDVVHDNSLIMTIPLMVACRRAGVKLRILHSHAARLGETRNKERRNRLFLPLLKACCNRFAACSEAAGRAMFGERPYVVLPNVVGDTAAQFSPGRRAQTRKAAGAEGRAVILSVGRACEQKNPFFALKVAERVMARRPEAVFWWVGDGPLLPRMQSLAAALGIAGRTVFWGKQSDVARLYEAADVFFLPSLFEGLPLTGIEAQAMGLPAVVSDAVTEEMVFTDLIAFLPLEQPAEAWAAALERQLERAPARRAYAEELKNSVFSAEHAGERLERYYRSQLNNE